MKYIRKEINCINSITLINYVKYKEGEIGLKDLFLDILNENFISDKYFIKEVDGSLKPITLEFFLNKNNFYSNEISLILFKNIKKMGLNLFEAGRFGVSSTINSEADWIVDIARLLGPKNTITSVNKINRKFNRTKIVKIIMSKNNSAKCRIYYNKDIDIIREVDVYNIGWYKGIFEAIGLENVKCKINFSASNGGKISEFEFYWKPKTFLNRISYYIEKSILRIIARNYLRDVEGKFVTQKRIADKFGDEVDRNNDLILQLEEKINQATKNLQIKNSKINELLHKLAPPQKVDMISEKKFIEKETYGTLFFADIVGFTAFSENIPPRKLGAIMYEHFIIIDEIVSKYGGYFHKNIGDSVMVLFNISDDFLEFSHPILATLCALEILEKSKLPIRIGINSGNVMEFLSDGYVWEIIGNTVNKAQRVESNGLPKNLAVSNESKMLIEDFFDSKILKRVVMKGYKKEENIYLVKGLKKIIDLEYIFTENIVYFNKEFNEFNEFKNKLFIKFQYLFKIDNDILIADAREGDPFTSKIRVFLSFCIFRKNNIKYDEEELFKMLLTSYLVNYGKALINNKDFYEISFKVEELNNEIKNLTLDYARENFDKEIVIELQKYYQKTKDINLKIIKLAEIYSNFLSRKKIEYYKGLLNESIENENIDEDLIKIANSFKFQIL